MIHDDNNSCSRILGVMVPARTSALRPVVLRSSNPRIPSKRPSAVSPRAAAPSTAPVGTLFLRNPCDTHDGTSSRNDPVLSSVCRCDGSSRSSGTHRVGSEMVGADLGSRICDSASAWSARTASAVVGRGSSPVAVWSTCSGTDRKVFIVGKGSFAALPPLEGVFSRLELIIMRDISD